MATTFREQLDEDRANAFLSTSEFAELVAYRVAATGVSTPDVPAQIEELAGAIENFHGQAPASRALVARISDDAVATPKQGDQLTRTNGQVLTVVRVTSDGLGMHELRCFLPETVS